MAQQPITAAWRLIIVLVILLAGAACTPQGGDNTVWPTDGWLTSTPEEQAMDPALLEQMMAFVDEQALAYDAVLVVRHGYIVLEEYRNGYDRDRQHHLQSATKSVSSMLIGIALHEGLLEGVDQKVVDLFPNHTIANLDARKERLTLAHLLTMSDGMDWHETDYAYTDARNTLGQMWTSRDAVQHVLDQPLAREPGQAWAYNSGTSILLGGVLEEATGRDVLDFARQYLFGPLGIDHVRWDRAPGNHYHTDGGLYLTPRDMARFGYLALHGGTWNGKEIVSPEWVARSTEAHYQASAGRGYGYQWWTLDGGIFAAHGHYEQLIYVVPAADMVVVLTGNIPDDVIPPSDGLLYRYILAACTDLAPGAASRTYANYGFTFEYPVGFGVAEMPFPGQEAPSREAGLVQFQFLSYPVELVEAVWVPENPDLDLEAHLAGFIETASQQAGGEYRAGESRAFAKGDHPALYQPFDFAQGGVHLRGVTVVWHCPESRRVFILSYATSPDVPDSELEERLQGHLDAFRCHEVP